MNKKFLTFLITLSILLLGVCIGFIVAASLGFCSFRTLSIYHWATIFTFLLVLFFVLLLFKTRNEEKQKSAKELKTEKDYLSLHEEMDHIRTDFEKFKREVRHFSKAQLEALFSLSNVSTNKEGDAFTNWKKNTLRQLKNSLNEIRWCQEILEEIKPANGKNSNKKEG